MDNIIDLTILLDYLKQCPYLDEYAQMLVEYLGNNATEYAINEVSINPIIRKYLDGTTERQLAFNFTSREFYGKEVAQNIANSNFYKKFASWLEEMTNTRKFPKFGDKIEVTSIEALSSGYLFQVSQGLDTAKYMIQCRMYYTQYK